MLAKKTKEVLLLLQREGLLGQIVLIGSWCCHFYISYFGKDRYFPSIQTLDLDLLIADPRKIEWGEEKSLSDLLRKLDFETEISHSKWLRFVHPELRVEFLLPQVGPTPDDPRTIKRLKINALPLRHTFPLTEHTIRTDSDGIQVTLPHPVAFALHKLMVSNRRREKDKSIRDKGMAFRILDVIQATKQTDDLPKIWSSFTKKEKREILGVIEKEGRSDLKALGIV